MEDDNDDDDTDADLVVVSSEKCLVSACFFFQLSLS